VINNVKRNVQSKRVTVTLPDKDHAFLAALVKSEGRSGKRVSISEVVREAVHEHVKRIKRRRG